ncbi:MAG: iron transporter, partial [Planctomycetota bacterium]|nr:iron transporter [Planctomycetota bacterium]
LFIPNTICCLKNSPNPTGGEKLLEALLRPEVESRLASGPSSQIPLHQSIRFDSRCLNGQPVRWMDVDFEAAAERWDTTADFLIEEFQGSP